MGKSSEVKNLKEKLKKIWKMWRDSWMAGDNGNLEIGLSIFAAS